MDDYTEAVGAAIISYVQVGASGSGTTSVHTVAIPSGGGGTEGLTIPEIVNKKSIVEIKAKDNGFGVVLQCCLWVVKIDTLRLVKVHKKKLLNIYAHKHLMSGVNV